MFDFMLLDKLFLLNKLLVLQLCKHFVAHKLCIKRLSKFSKKLYIKNFTFGDLLILVQVLYLSKRETLL